MEWKENKEYKNGNVGCENKTKMNLQEVAIPCGLFAKSLFNDTF